jgi:hypothetical protein
MDKGKVKGVDIDDKNETKKIYDRYVEAFKKGVYNYIREDFDPATQTIIPRKYFSGGVRWTDDKTEYRPTALAPAEVRTPAGPQFVVAVNMDFTRGWHDKFNERVRNVLEGIYRKQETDNGKDNQSIERAVRQAGEAKDDLKITPTRVTPDGIKVFINPGFEGIEHAGRDRNAVYASSEAKAVHEIRELELLRAYAVDEGMDISQGLGAGIQNWANDTSIPETARLARQNALRQLIYDTHQEGLQAEAEVLGQSYEIDRQQMSSFAEVIEDFDIIVAGNGDCDLNDKKTPASGASALIENKAADIRWEHENIEESLNRILEIGDARDGKLKAKVNKVAMLMSGGTDARSAVMRKIIEDFVNIYDINFGKLKSSTKARLLTIAEKISGQSTYDIWGGFINEIAQQFGFDIREINDNEKQRILTAALYVSLGAKIKKDGKDVSIREEIFKAAIETIKEALGSAGRS